MTSILGSLPPQKDVFGFAVSDYAQNGWADDIIVNSSLFDPDVIPVDYLFRTFDEMPPLEQKAMSLCKGKVLDVGACAGPHSRYLKSKGFDVSQIDVSPKAIELLKKDGFENAECCNFFGYQQSGFDTMLMMMNGLGIVESLHSLDLFFQKLKMILKDDGQLILDSSDLRYLYDEEDMELCSCSYYGEIDFKMQYNAMETDIFHWLYIDFETLEVYASDNGFKAEKIADGDHYDYLARLVRE